MHAFFRTPPTNQTNRINPPTHPIPFLPELNPTPHTAPKPAPAPVAEKPKPAPKPAAAPAPAAPSSVAGDAPSARALPADTSVDPAFLESLKGSKKGKKL